VSSVGIGATDRATLDAFMDERAEESVNHAGLSGGHMRKLLAIGTILLALGCSESTAPTVSAEGTWHLQTVNGFAVPFVSPDGNGGSIELTSDEIVADALGGFTQMTVTKTTTGGQVTIDSIPDAGTYTIKRNAVTFTFFSDSPSGAGIIEGNTMTVTTDITLVYRRDE
jgi:hypothetical protein